MRSRSTTTDVSSRPRACSGVASTSLGDGPRCRRRDACAGSGIDRRIDHGVEVAPQPREIDTRRPTCRISDHGTRHEPAPRNRSKLGHWRPIAGDRDGLSRLDVSQHRSGVVAQLSLADGPHRATVADVAHRSIASRLDFALPIGQPHSCQCMRVLRCRGPRVASRVSVPPHRVYRCRPPDPATDARRGLPGRHPRTTSRPKQATEAGSTVASASGSQSLAQPDLLDHGFSRSGIRSGCCGRRRRASNGSRDDRPRRGRWAAGIGPGPGHRPEEGRGEVTIRPTPRQRSCVTAACLGRQDGRDPVFDARGLEVSISVGGSGAALVARRASGSAARSSPMSPRGVGSPSATISRPWAASSAG